MNRPTARIRLGALAALLISALPLALAQSFATKPIRIITPFAAGGSTDVLARALGEGLMRDLGQPAIVESKTGAGSVLGNDAVAKSPPDGHTLLLTTSAFAIVPSLNARLPYSQQTGFTPITVLGRAPNVFFVRADSPLKSGADFIAQARANPGKLSYGSSGNGSSTHLTAELLKISAKVFMIHIPYRGASAVVTDALGGQIDVGVATLPSIMPMIISGRVRALAVSGKTRSPALSNVPTVAESGVPGFEADNWYGIFAPGGTPPAIVKPLYDAIKAAAGTPAFRQRASSEGLVVTLDTPEATTALVRAEEAKWRRVVKEQSITAE
jgi:tripartite-type tricarboxylate transporter receptor subunit TctC